MDDFSQFLFIKYLSQYKQFNTLKGLKNYDCFFFSEWSLHYVFSENKHHLRLVHPYKPIHIKFGK